MIKKYAKAVKVKHNNVSRRIFIGSSLAIGLGTFFLFEQSKKPVIMHTNDVQVLLHCAYHLFPQSKLGPGAADLNISSYLAQVLSDSRILEEDRHYFLQGARWLEESAFEEYGRSFLNMTYSQREELLQKIVQYRWGENFIASLLSYIFEALLSSPAYGSNIDEIGWKWLEHQAGFPQPKSKDEIVYAV